MTNHPFTQQHRPGSLDAQTYHHPSSTGQIPSDGFSAAGSLTSQSAFRPASISPHDHLPAPIESHASPLEADDAADDLTGDDSTGDSTSSSYYAASGAGSMGSALSGAAGSSAGMGYSRRILVVEDERDLASMLEYNLKRAGYLPIIWHDGARALEMAKSAPPDLVILDLMLPGMPGLEVARHLRSHVSTQAIPILMLTARAEETDQVAGLAAGADDYVTKPFSMKVLLARVEALLRRVSPAGSDGGAGLITVGLIVADPSSHIVTVEGQIIKLTLTEFRLLLALLQSPKRVLSRNELIARVMGPGIVVTARTIDVHVASIRKKLGPAGGQIRTIRGVGYQLGTEAEANAEMG